MRSGCQAQFTNQIQPRHPSTRPSPLHSPSLYSQRVAPVLQIAALNDHALIHGFSTMELGSVGLTHAKNPEAVRDARRRFPAALNLDPDPLTRPSAAQLNAAGVRDVFNLDLCTKETEALPSHRRDHDGRRFGAIVALR